ncbi:DUF6194 family protein [Saccharopolyspora sp. NPDC047091]|uniref:DUF6194 family protein n=1 Tax=Saccharopolyspora sp. NPDC047091 TaxID=3155924 RepID=UPI00340D9277
MEFDEIRAVLAGFPGAKLLAANGDLFAVHDPDGDYDENPTFPWATLVTSDAYDSASELDRPGVHRLNIGLPKARFRELVDVDAAHDLTALDVLLPHPVYAGQHWLCVLNPDRTWPVVRGLLGEAHEFAVRKHANIARRRER